MAFKISTAYQGRRVAICDMANGQVGVTDDGQHYYRAGKTAVCLECPGDSFTASAASVALEVTIVPPGTRLVFTVTDAEEDDD